VNGARGRNYRRYGSLRREGVDDGYTEGCPLYRRRGENDGGVVHTEKISAA